MNEIRVLLDVSMCLLWIMTYTLVLIGTIKYRYPLISPITQAIIAPLEFSVLLVFIKWNGFRWDYATFAYLYWSVIEIVIVSLMMKYGYIREKFRVPYIIAVISITVIMVYWVTIQEDVFFFNYLNTFCGICMWLAFVIKNKDYPMKPITLTLFVTKFAADICAFIVYNGAGNKAADAMCVLLPIVDLLFIVLYLKRKRAGVR